MTHYFIIPGLGNSGPGHWQTYFEKTLPNAQRIQQKEWVWPMERGIVDSGAIKISVWLEKGLGQ